MSFPLRYVRIVSGHHSQIGIGKNLYQGTLEVHQQALSPQGVCPCNAKSKQEP